MLFPCTPRWTKCLFPSDFSVKVCVCVCVARACVCVCVCRLSHARDGSCLCRPSLFDQHIMNSPSS